MRLTSHANKLETNTETTSQDFGIGDASVVIEILRNRLYEHKIRTLVQEYISNGRDAQREAKSTKRMIVTVPNALNPVFKVRDFGLGISPDRMKNVFVLYGASTKRGTNNQTGGFGIGAKSAWSYTDSFTIVSVTQGIKRTYVAHTGSSNTGRLEMISEVETKEDDGTEIQVAIKPNDAREFQSACFRATYFWNESEKPTFKGVTAIDVPEYNSGLKIGQNLEIVSGFPDFLDINYHEKAVLVIDGITYPLPEKILHKITNLENLTRRVKQKVIVKITNGIVEVSASREAIADSDFTKNNLNRLCLKLADEVENYIRDSFKAVKSNNDWIKTYTEMSKTLEVDGHAKYGDYEIKHGNIESKLFSKIKMTVVDYNTRRSKVEVRRDYSTAKATLRLEDLTNIFFVDDTKESLVLQNRRLRDFFSAQKSTQYNGMTKTNQRITQIILLSAVEKQVAVLIKDANGVDTDKTTMKIVTSLKDSDKACKQVIGDFDAKPISTMPLIPIVRLPKEKKDRTKEHFTIHRMNGGHKSPTTVTLQDVSAKYLWIPLQDVEAFKTEFEDISEFIRQEFNLHLCALSPQSVEIVQGSGNFFPYREWVKTFKPTDKLIKKAKSVKATSYAVMKALDKATDKIKDKHISKMLTEYQGLSEKDKLLVPQTIAKWVADEIKDFVTEDKKLEDLLKAQYPLVAQSIDHYNRPAMMNEIVFYINAKN